jgi:uncharacterized coiled-coil protein SlyX
MDGPARELNEGYLARIDLDTFLNGIGIYRATQRHRLGPGPGPAIVENVFVRDHREVDVTSYGDAYPQTLVVSPGLHVEVADTPDLRETKIFAMGLLIDGLEMRLDGEERAFADLSRKYRELDAENDRKSADLLVLYDRMGKRAKKTFAAKHPDVAKRLEELDDERERERRADSYYADSYYNDW